MRKLWCLLATATLAWVLTGCLSGDPLFDETPSLSSARIVATPGGQPLEQLSRGGSFYLEVDFRDGDGDLGTDDATAFNIFITTQGFNYPEIAGNIPVLTRDNNQPAIEGVIRYFSADPFFGDNAPAGSVPFTLSVRVVDNAGNESNSALTPTLTLLP